MIEKWHILGLLAVTLFGFGSFFGKLASFNDIPARVYFFEAVGTLTVFTTFVLLKKSDIFTNFSINHYGILMGLTWGLGTVLFILALEKSKLSLITPLTALYPAVTVLLAILFLKEQLNFREICGIVLAVISIFVLVK